MKKNIRVLGVAMILLFGFTTMLAQNSVLSSGNWCKIAVENTGIHKITYDNLVSFGIDPGSINPKNIRIYGNGNGMLPEPVNVFRYNDLQENAIFVFGEDDEVFDQGDYILFYGESPTEWKLDDATGLFEHKVNLYSDLTYYFITVDLGSGKRIEEQYSTVIPPTFTTTSFNDYYFHEMELENLIHTGRNWYGERFEEITGYNFQVDFPNLKTNSAIYFEVNVIARSAITSNIAVSLENQQLLSLSIQPSSSNPNGDFAKSRWDTAWFYSTNPELNLTFLYDQPTDSSIAWLGYFTLNARRNLVFDAGQMCFRDTQSPGPGKVTQFQVQTTNENVNIWNITDPLNPKHVNQNYSSGMIDFTFETDSLLEFIAFDGSQFYTPDFDEQLENQNLHGLEPVDLVVVTGQDFIIPAQQLADFRELHDGLSSVVVTPDIIYNEFSSGAQDITAIRDFLKNMYEQSNGENPKYLLLFGDASYDYKDRIENNTNFVPVWESSESLNPVGSFCTDDIFGILDDDNMLDIGIGRLPVKTFQEAQDMVTKIIYYSSDINSYGAWRNEICLVADDEDMNLHFNDSEKLGVQVDTAAPDFNIFKIYLDAYEQITTEEGNFYPDVNQAITDKINSGVSIINYVGHGGYEALAHEKIFTENDINNWNNIQFPVFVAATCDFGLFDDPDIHSLTEQSLLLADKGMIAVCAASRATYAGGNAVFQKHFFRFLLDKPTLPLGHVFSLAKNNTGSNDNTRKQILFGDPSMKITIPALTVLTEAINGQNILNPIDTVNPGEQVIVSGYIADPQGNTVYNFNGNLYVKIFDRADTVFTLGNDNSSFITEFIRQDSILLEMETVVLNGQFAFIFNLPYEMDEAYGNLKFSFYSVDFPNDASGHFFELIAGGQPSALFESPVEQFILNFYPTITKDYLNYSVQQDIRSLAIDVFDITGKKVITFSSSNHLKGEQNRIDLTELQDGFYIINAIADGQPIRWKVIKK